MKAIIKATGEIATVECRWVTTIGGNDVLRFIDQNTGISYTEHQLGFLFQEDNKREPDYWTRLEHQAAIGAMQALLSSDTMMEVLSRRDNGTMEEEVASEAFDYAHALVKKLKSE